MIDKAISPLRRPQEIGQRAPLTIPRLAKREISFWPHRQQISLITPINLRIESYNLLLPPESRESQYLRYVVEL
jgi:hypothetical protein